MRRVRVVVVLACVLVLVGSPIVQADREYRTYLPIVGAYKMGLWNVVEPEPTTNKVQNPNGANAGNFAAVGGGTMTSVTTYAFRGRRSFRVQTNANNEGGSVTLSALPNAIHYATIRVRGTLPASWDWSLDNAAYTTPVLIDDYDGIWSLYGLQFPAAQANGSTTLYFRQNGAGAGDFYVDCLQVEQKTYWTTFCDGGEPGCVWDGAPNSGDSTRSALSRAGGRLWDFADLSFEISAYIGSGLSGMSVNLDPLAVLPGAEMNSVKTEARRFGLAGVITGTSLENLQDNRQTLVRLLSDEIYPNTQPIRMQYDGATVIKEISVYYQGGLQGNITARLECWEQRITLRFIAVDPNFYSMDEDHIDLDEEDSATFRIVAGRLRANGQWDDLGPPNVAGTYTAIYAMIFDPDTGYIYYGGDFTNFNNIAAADYIVRYNPETGGWAAVGAGLNDVVRALAIGPDETLYIGGDFSNAGGVGAADGLATWDGAVYAAVDAATLNVGGGETVESLAFGPDGTLYIGGLFQNLAGVGAADNFATWDGTAIAGLATLNGRVFTIAVSREGVIYIGGDFSNAGGVGAADYIAYWTGTQWDSLGDIALNSTVLTLIYDNDRGLLYLGGVFFNAGDIADADKIASWNGQAYAGLGTGVSAGSVYSLLLAPDGVLYAGGSFTEIGGIEVADRYALWNGSTWAHLDLDLPGAPIGRAILATNIDPVIQQNYDLWLGYTATGAGTFGGTVTATNNGTANAYPIIKLFRSGGTSAIVKMIRNEMLGLTLYMNYGLLDDENLEIDLRPGHKTIISNFWGTRMDAILPNSDFATFRLAPGDNIISLYIDDTGGATYSSRILWHHTYGSMD